ncbi:hypothetical protein AFLA_012459 [Aspergillus flavus NRRL3357]|nr:uncharacterized protein G4B84_002446 [Aspergillus flavus NRRL3357]KAF7631604.1 hypothetical protein AFLA_012459 [Aspergillus flavus NRRL3357]QMW27157.1 hypothetical protein G4B84_002446 [Aspergillus flavus NRRL3357]
MDHLRDSLLSSVPRDTPSTAAIDHARIDREGTRQAVAWGEFKEVRDMAFSNRTWVVTSRYCDIGNGVDSLEGHIHSLWYMYYEFGKNISSESSEHEGLVLDILRIQGMGPLTRPARGVSGINIARTVDGTLWNDLPFMVCEQDSALSGQQSVLGDSSQSRKNARDADFLGSTDMAQDMAGLL